MYFRLKINDKNTEFINSITSVPDIFNNEYTIELDFLANIVKESNVSMLDYILEYFNEIKMDGDWQYVFGNLLYNACLYSDINTVTYLMHKQFDKNMAAHFYFACSRSDDNPEIIDCMFQIHPGFFNDSIFYPAIRADNILIFKYLLLKFNDKDLPIDSYARTALKSNSIKILDYLVRNHDVLKEIKDYVRNHSLDSELKDVMETWIDEGIITDGINFIH
jgi:hypothetical protein